jgi:hypothetical protein
MAGAWGRALGGVRGYQHVRPSEWESLLSEGKQRALRERGLEPGSDEEEEGEEVADDELEQYEDDETFRAVGADDMDKEEYAAAVANFAAVVTAADRQQVEDTSRLHSLPLSTASPRSLALSLCA